MRKKITAVLLACMMCVTGFWCGNVETCAEESQGQDVDYSYLMNETTLIGYADMQTWGVYLGTGISSINKLGTNTIGVGGTTTAAIKCKVAVTSIVERYVDGKWARVTSWSQTNDYSFSASISKSLVVATGNIYRVRSAHYANTDVSSSYTNGLVM